MTDQLIEIGCRMAQELQDFADEAVKAGNPLPSVSALIDEWNEEYQSTNESELNINGLHVDDFIDTHFRKDCYARWVLNHFRLSAALQIDFNEFMNQYMLFCDWNSKRMRCTGASRLGDVWLHSDFTKTSGYEHRVLVSDCSNWGDTP